LGDQIRRIILAGESRIALGIAGICASGQFLMGRKIGVGQSDAAVVVPDVGGIIVVGAPLAVVAEEAIETLLERVARGTRPAQSPFAKRAGGVTLLLQQPGDGNSVCGNGNLAFGLD